MPLRPPASARPRRPAGRHPAARMSPPPISVIVPMWNVADHVAACLQSLAAQRLGDFEAIVVDDGSTDDSLARARAAVAGDARFAFLEQPNRGLSAARNAGLAAARGAFIAFLDSDDRLAPDYLAALHGALTAHGADWVACGVRFCDPGGASLVHPAIHGPPPAGVRGGQGAAVRFALPDWPAVIRHYPSAWNKLYRRTLIGDLPFDAGSLYEDHAFFWQLSLRTDHLLWLPHPLYLQTQGRAGQITGDGGEAVFAQLAVLDRLAGIVAGSDRPGGPAALARIATRLGFERARRIGDADRAARFAAACRAWFARHHLAPDSAWPVEERDDDAGHGWLAALRSAGAAGGLLPDPAPSPSEDPGAAAGDGWTQDGKSPITAPGDSPPQAPPGTETEMLSFQARNGAALTYEVDFRRISYANISFFDRDQSVILFHLSLRLREWLASCNRRLTGAWEDERQHPVMLEETGDRVEIRFVDAATVEVRLNDELLCRHEGSFDRLDEIAGFDFQGGIVAASLALAADGVENGQAGDTGHDTEGASALAPQAGAPADPTAAADPAAAGLAAPSPPGIALADMAPAQPTRRGARRGLGALRLALPMRLEGWVLDPRPAEAAGTPAGDAEVRLVLSGGVTAPAPVLHPLPESADMPEVARLGFTATLPGRIWLELAAATAPDSPSGGRAGKRGAVAAGAPKGRRSTAAPSTAQDRQADAGDEVLEVEVSVAGQPCGLPLLIRRADICAQIEALATAPAPEGDTAAILLAIEHARFGGFWSELSAAARDGLARAARHYRVTAFLFPPQAPGDPDADTPGDAAPAAAGSIPAVARPSPEAFLLARLRDRFSETLRSAPETDPAALLAELLRGPVPPAVRRELYLELTDFFCARDAFAALFAQAGRDRQISFEVTGPANAWHSTFLPFLYLEGRFDALRTVFWDLSKRPPGWLGTPSLGWVVRDLLGPGAGRCDEATRDDLLYAFMAVVEAERRDPDGRAPCVALIAAVLAMLGAAPRMAVYLRRDIECFALRCYGLSRAFWDGVAAVEAAGQLRLSPRLAAAQAGFAAVAAAAGPGRSAAEAQAAAEALRLFAGCGCAEVDRVRRDLFGPAGLPGTGLPDPAALMAAGIDVEEAALRSLAAPEAAGISPPPALVELAREAVAVRHTLLQQTPLAGLQELAGRRALALLTGLAAGGAAAEAATAGFEPLLGDIALLSCGRSDFTGIGLGLRLLHGLLRLGHADLAERVLLDLSAAVAALSPGEASRLPTAPALLSALWGLARHTTEPGADTAPPLAAMALALFPEALPEVEALAEAAPTTPALPATGPLAPLFDTLVVVLSCKPYLDRRIPPMEAGWLGRLDALGVPWVVAVGDGGARSRTAPGGGRLEGRILHLDAPDDYEGLPQKTLAVVRWVHDCTGVAHLLKIDDDCFLDPAGLFCTQSYAKFDYYGRRIDRKPGDMDRAWHNAKSTSPRGRLELDKSPEPSSYCDGGAGYVLGRRAMAALLAEAASPAAQELIAASFMEDKLVGDLLARRRIAPHEQDYFTAVLRRTHAGATPVPLWANSFLPSRASGTRMAHLDSSDLQAEAMAILDSDRLHPPRIWPTPQQSRLGYNSNALTLVGDGARLAKAAAAPVAVVACVHNEMFMLPHFLAHYRSMGVEGFLIADNCSDDGTLEYLAEQPDVALFSVDTDYSASAYGVAWQQALLAHYRPGRWTVVADADELLFADADRRTRLPDLLAGAEYAGAEAVRLFMLDMYPKGPLAAADFASGDPFAEADHVERDPFRVNWLGLGPFSDAPTWTSALRHRLFPGSRPEIFVAQKIALLRYMPWMRLSAGLHYVADARIATRALAFAHFKYTAAFAARVRAEVARGQHFNDAEEYRKYLALVAEGRERLYDPAISVPWQDCATVRSLLGTPVQTRRRRKVS